MTLAQWVFWIIVLGLSPSLALWVYPGVRRHAERSYESWLAAIMAATLVSIACALSLSFVVNIATHYLE